MEYATTQTKAPAEVWDYAISYADILNGDTIQASVWGVDPAGPVMGLDSNTPTSATVWLSGGTDGEEYRITNTITTAGGRTAQRSFVLRIRENL